MNETRDFADHFHIATLTLGHLDDENNSVITSSPQIALSNSEQKILGCDFFHIETTLVNSRNELLAKSDLSLEEKAELNLIEIYSL